MLSFTSKEPDLEGTYLQLQFLAAVDDQDRHVYVNPADMSTPLLHHIAHELQQWQEQSGVFKPCVGNTNDPRGTVRIHFHKDRNQGSWKGIEGKKEHACLDCISSRRFCVVRQPRRDKTYIVLPLPPFIRYPRKVAEEEYWRLGEGIDVKAIAKRWRPEIPKS